MRLVVFSVLLTVATALPQLLPSTLEAEFLSQFPKQSDFQRGQLPITFQSVKPNIGARQIRRQVALKSQQFQHNLDGSYNHRQVFSVPIINELLKKLKKSILKNENRFETDDGTLVETTCQPKDIDVDQLGNVCRGSFSYISPEGKSINVQWTAHQNGFKSIVT